MQSMHKRACKLCFALFLSYSRYIHIKRFYKIKSKLDIKQNKKKFNKNKLNVNLMNDL